jgi:hypothetical protein
MANGRAASGPHHACARRSAAIVVRAMKDRSDLGDLTASFSISEHSAGTSSQRPAAVRPASAAARVAAGAAVVALRAAGAAAVALRAAEAAVGQRHAVAGVAAQPGPVAAGAAPGPAVVVARREFEAAAGVAGSPADVVAVVEAAGRVRSVA